MARRQFPVISENCAANKDAAEIEDAAAKQEAPSEKRRRRRTGGSRPLQAGVKGKARGRPRSSRVRTRWWPASRPDSAFSPPVRIRWCRGRSKAAARCRTRPIRLIPATCCCWPTSRVDLTHHRPGAGGPDRAARAPKTVTAVAEVAEPDAAVLAAAVPARVGADRGGGADRRVRRGAGRAGQLHVLRLHRRGRPAGRTARRASPWREALAAVSARAAPGQERSPAWATTGTALASGTDRSREDGQV